MNLLLTALLSTAQAERSTAVTISPLLLSSPIAEVTVERVLAEKVSAAAIAGFGTIDDATVWELGGQGRYFLFGDFGTNVHLGAEAVYIRANEDALGVTFTSHGVSAGPLIGGKWTAEVGFTAEMQLGAGYTVARASGSGGEKTSQEASVIPLLNLNLGWSF